DVHIATPYGVTSHLLIPIVDPPVVASPTGLLWSPHRSFSATATFDANPFAFKDVVKEADAPAEMAVIDFNARAIPSPSISDKSTLKVLVVARTADGGIGLANPILVELTPSYDKRRLAVQTVKLVDQLKAIPQIKSFLEDERKKGSTRVLLEVSGGGITPDNLRIDNALQIGVTLATPK